MNSQLLADLRAAYGELERDDGVLVGVAAESAIFEITEVRLGQMYGWESGRELGLARTASMEMA